MRFKEVRPFQLNDMYNVIVNCCFRLIIKGTSENYLLILQPTRSIGLTVGSWSLSFLKSFWYH